MRRRKYPLFCTVISQGPLVIVRLPEEPQPWRILIRELARALKRDHGVLGREIHTLEGLAGMPPGEDLHEEPGTLARLESAYSGNPEPFARFKFYGWDSDTQKIVLIRENSA